jgi:hypothetical protein
MNPLSAELFRPYLFADERVLWTGRPKQGLLLTGRDSFLIPFSLLWGGFALFWNIGVWAIPGGGGANPDWFFRLWGLPFLALGIYMIVGRFIHDAWIRRRLSYAVTNQRVLVLRNAMASRLSSLDLHRLPRLELSEQRDGTGSIAFESDSSMFGFGRTNGFQGWLPSLAAGIQFLRIDHPRSVYELIQKQSRV